MSAVVDLVFELSGRQLPANLAPALYAALRQALPWLAQENVGVHPLRGAETSEGARFLGRRASLVLRLPAGRADDARVLTGMQLDLDGHTLAVGAGRLRPLKHSATLYSRCVVTGHADEAGFVAAVEAELAALGAVCPFLPGRRCHVQADGERLTGYSLLLHGLDEARSLRVQSAGLGAHHHLGCGIFVPHKSVAAVAEVA